MCCLPLKVGAGLPMKMDDMAGVATEHKAPRKRRRGANLQDIYPANKKKTKSAGRKQASEPHNNDAARRIQKGGSEATKEDSDGVRRGTDNQVKGETGGIVRARAEEGLHGLSTAIASSTRSGDQFMGPAGELHAERPLIEMYTGPYLHGEG